MWFAPSSTIPNGSLVISLLQAAKGEITSLMTVPTILEDITLQTNFLSHAAGELAKLDFVVVGGGGIKDAVGSKLASNGVTLLNHFGATELGALAPIFQPEDGHDWRYLRIRTDLGLRLESVESQGSDSDVSRCKLIGHPFAWEEEFELQDDLAANPEKPDSEVKILGRNDDVIILATGENVLPHPLERTLEQHCLVKRAIVFGHGQFELGLLIESLPTFGGPPEELVDEIWSTVEEANKLMDNHARISSKGAILVKPAEKDIPLTDKQSMKRKTVYKEFGQEISAVYTRLAADDISTSSVPIDLENLEESLRIIAQSCLPIYNNSEPWNDNSDFIALGMDSLQATRFRRILQASIQRSGASIPLLADLPLDIIYSNPSVNTLAKALKSWFHGSDSDLDPTKDMTNLIEKYAYAQRDSSVRGDKNIVLVTGSTGNLGANLLQGLSENQSIDGIICLIRSRSNEDASQESLVTRQRKALEDRGIILSESAWSKINLLSWFPGADKLGLSEDNFRSLSLCVTHIFHGAWPMDFKVKVRSLEPQVKAMRDLIELARLAHVSKPSVRPRVVLASSIAVVGRYHSDLQPSIVPETPMDDARSPLPIGYAEAKWVCEKVMESAYYHLKDVEPIIVRIGQLSGSNKTGFWSPKEHFPALVRASQEIGALPDMQGVRCSSPIPAPLLITM